MRITEWGVNLNHLWHYELTKSLSQSVNCSSEPTINGSNYVCSWKTHLKAFKSQDSDLSGSRVCPLPTDENHASCLSGGWFFLVFSLLIWIVVCVAGRLCSQLHDSVTYRAILMTPCLVPVSILWRTSVPTTWLEHPRRVSWPFPPARRGNVIAALVP